MRTATMMRCLALLIAGGVTSTFWAVPAQAVVVWTFIETSCTAIAGGCDELPPLPGPIGATLTVPDINSSGTYSFFQSIDQPTPIVTGDMNFFFDWGGKQAPPPFLPCFQPVFVSFCQWDISFGSSPTGLDISVNYFGGLNDNINLFDPGTEGMIGSDGIMPGCGDFRQCRITGFWTLSSSAPEPSSVLTLATALIGFFFFRARRRAVFDSAISRLRR